MISDSYKEYILEQLASLPKVTVRPMFGGACIYSNGTVFALLDDDRMYMKVNEKTKQFYIDQDLKPFEYAPGQVMKSYYEIPEEIVEDREQLTEWANNYLNS